MPRHSIRMKNGYLIAKPDIAYSAPRCCSIAAVKALALGLYHLARLIAAQIADDHPLAFRKSRQNLDVIGAFHSHFHLPRLHPVLRVHHQHARLCCRQNAGWLRSERSSTSARLLALNCDIGVHSGLQMVVGVGNVDFDLHGSGRRIERVGEAGDFAGEVFAGRLHMHVGGIANADFRGQRFGHRNAQAQNVQPGRR